MWKVKNERNTPYLFKYNTRVIVPFFKLWFKVSQEADLAEKLAEDDFWEEYLKLNPIINKRFLNNNKTKENQVKPLLSEIVLLGYAAIKQEWDHYAAQNRAIYEGDYNIARVDHAQPIAKFFKDYFYEFYWGLDWVWKEIVGMPFSRGSFHDNFKKENKLTICSYCDVDTIAAARNSSVEHFLPKDHFPLISCNPRNLIPCCNACNMGSSGKGTDHKMPIYSQFNRQIGEDIQFRLVQGKIDIEIHNDPAIENFITLLKLRNRYKEAPVGAAVLNRFRIHYNVFLKASAGGNIDKSDFFEFIRTIGRDSGHYFVQRDLLDHVDLILPKKV